MNSLDFLVFIKATISSLSSQHALLEQLATKEHSEAVAESAKALGNLRTSLQLCENPRNT
ncbi:hypothetical protein BGP84_06230 [Pseudomonas putida]|uniref:Uncharacterized protein n=1 Tax=Pseudomonas putida TaxID=303 RepID=A0A2S3X1A8_PSEPU|nr:hypothetical protein BGP84_06230 [Pseudomonas putida]